MEYPGRFLRCSFILKFEGDNLFHILCELTLTEPGNWSLKFNCELEKNKRVTNVF